jgi:hypothetical protein
LRIVRRWHNNPQNGLEKIGRIFPEIYFSSTEAGKEIAALMVDGESVPIGWESLKTDR